MKRLAQKFALFVALSAPAGCYVQTGAAVPVEGQVIAAEPPPPPMVVETAPPPPSAGVVWVAGYHRWEGRRYVWERARYERPPYRNARYVHGHWEARGRGRVWVNSHWHSG